MVQVQPNLLLTLKHLAPYGAVLPAEALVAIDQSLPIKRAESGLRSLILWGRILCRNGKDYLVAEGSNSGTVKGKEVKLDLKYFFSQDGIRWADLPAIDATTAASACKLRSPLTGDPAFQHKVPADGAETAAAAAEAEVEAEGTGGEGGHRAVVSEAARLRAMIDSINKLTDVVPKGCVLANAHNQLVQNRLFGGLEHPDKLESYTHRVRALEDKVSLASDDVRGCWSLLADKFKGVAVLRSLLVPGYFFYYSSSEMTWGGLYVGDGLQNNDLVFML